MFISKMLEFLEISTILLGNRVKKEDLETLCKKIIQKCVFTRLFQNVVEVGYDSVIYWTYKTRYTSFKAGNLDSLIVETSF